MPVHNGVAKDVSAFAVLQYIFRFAYLKLVRGNPGRADACSILKKLPDRWRAA